MKRKIYEEESSAVKGPKRKIIKKIFRPERLLTKKLVLNIKKLETAARTAEEAEILSNNEAEKRNQDEVIKFTTNNDAKRDAIGDVAPTKGDERGDFCSVGDATPKETRELQYLDGNKSQNYRENVDRCFDKLLVNVERSKREQLEMDEEPELNLQLAKDERRENDNWAQDNEIHKHYSSNATISSADSGYSVAEVTESLPAVILQSEEDDCGEGEEKEMGAAISKGDNAKKDKDVTYYLKTGAQGENDNEQKQSKKSKKRAKRVAAEQEKAKIPEQSNSGPIANLTGSQPMEVESTTKRKPEVPLEEWWDPMKAIRRCRVGRFRITSDIPDNEMNRILEAKSKKGPIEFRYEADIAKVLTLEDLYSAMIGKKGTVERKNFLASLDQIFQTLDTFQLKGVFREGWKDEATETIRNNFIIRALVHNNMLESAWVHPDFHPYDDARRECDDPKGMIMFKREVARIDFEIILATTTGIAIPKSLAFNVGYGVLGSAKYQTFLKQKILPGRGKEEKEEFFFESTPDKRRLRIRVCRVKADGGGSYRQVSFIESDEFHTITLDGDNEEETLKPEGRLRRGDKAWFQTKKFITELHREWDTRKRDEVKDWAYREYDEILTQLLKLNSNNKLMTDGRGLLLAMIRGNKDRKRTAAEVVVEGGGARSTYEPKAPKEEFTTVQKKNRTITAYHNRFKTACIKNPPNLDGIPYEAIVIMPVQYVDKLILRTRQMFRLDENAWPILRATLKKGRYAPNYQGMSIFGGDFKNLYNKCIYNLDDEDGLCYLVDPEDYDPATEIAALRSWMKYGWNEDGPIPPEKRPAWFRWDLEIKPLPGRSGSVAGGFASARRSSERSSLR